MSVARGAAAGALAGAVGTAAMDLLLYSRYRRDDGKDSFWRWDSAGGVTSWDEASAPGQVGKKLEQLVTRRPPPDNWARSTTNVTHWATGIGWGIQYGALAAKSVAPSAHWCACARRGGVAVELRGAPAVEVVQADLGVRRADARRRFVGPPSVRNRNGRRVRGPYSGELMTNTTLASNTSQLQDLLGQTVVVIGGSSGIGLETARLARTHGADCCAHGSQP